MSEYTLLSGATYYANFGTIGINEDLEVSQGCDGPLLNQDFDSVAEWSVADRLDLAKMMINRWTCYAKEILHAN